MIGILDNEKYIINELLTFPAKLRTQISSRTYISFHIRRYAVYSSKSDPPRYKTNICSKNIRIIPHESQTLDRHARKIRPSQHSQHIWSIWRRELHHSYPRFYGRRRAVWADQSEKKIDRELSKTLYQNSCGRCSLLSLAGSHSPWYQGKLFKYLAGKFTVDHQRTWWTSEIGRFRYQSNSFW